jgi:hypothetical protein
MDKSYPIFKNKHGHIGFAVLVNNYNFKPTPRLGSDLDVKSIKSTLSNLNF